LSKGLGDADRRPYRPGKRNYVPLMIVGKICNFEAYASSIMGNSTQRSEHIKDATDFFTAVASGTLPAVSFVKPDGLIDGSSATSKLDCYYLTNPSRIGWATFGLRQKASARNFCELSTYAPIRSIWRSSMTRLRARNTISSLRCSPP
jgi:hypothetical protein